MEKQGFTRDAFSRYVTQGKMWNISIIMSDFRDFTALPADMHPEKVITFLSRYLGKIIAILGNYHATIDEIVSNGILVFFGAPEPQEDHPVRAVACALTMQAAIEDINASNIATAFLLWRWALPSIPAQW